MVVKKIEMLNLMCSGFTVKINTGCRFALKVSTVEPQNNGQVGASTIVHYSEVSFIGRFTSSYLIMIKRNYVRSHTIAIVFSPEKNSYASPPNHGREGGRAFTIWVENYN